MNLKIDLVRQKLIRNTIALSHLSSNLGSFRKKLKCSMCSDSSRKNLWPRRFS
jgi:hypothetical protein